MTHPTRRSYILDGRPLMDRYPLGLRHTGILVHEILTDCQPSVIPPEQCNEIVFNHIRRAYRQVAGYAPVFTIRVSYPLIIITTWS